jgi:hypothetical protein
LWDWWVGQFKRTWTEASLDSSPALLEVEGFYQSPDLLYVRAPCPANPNLLDPITAKLCSYEKVKPYTYISAESAASTSPYTLRSLKAEGITLAQSFLYASVSQTFFKWRPLLLARMFYGPPYSCPLWKQIYHFFKW